jgi:polyhydroxybutyrate depolymerase
LDWVLHDGREAMNKSISTAIGLILCVLLAYIVSTSVFPGLQGHASAGTFISTSIPSQGCGKPAPVQPGTSEVESINSGGVTRWYVLYLPPDYRASSKYALVLNFHGHGSNAFQQAARSGFTTLAGQQGFIVVYPQGTIGPDGFTGWATGLAARPQVNDALFVSDLLNHLQATLCIDPSRIYATGFSNGGGMTNLLACKLAGRIAAFAPVSGSYPPTPGGCHPQRPVSILEFHGSADHTVPYTGNPRHREPPIALWLQQWASRDNCTRGPTTFYRSQDVIGEEWTDCKGNATVVGYRMLGEGHQWPTVLFHVRTGNTVESDTASDLIWSFFLSHPFVAVKDDAAHSQ